MTRRRRLGRGTAAAAVALALGMPGAGAQSPAGPATTLTLGGYARVLGGVQDLGYKPPGVDRRSGFNGDVIRLKWLLDAGGRVRVSVHNRVQARLSTATSEGDALGFGVSAAPTRSVDLVTTLVDDEHVRVSHDLDRLAISVFLDPVDLTVGRQAITWGISGVFPVADLWAQFSPFELDTEEKPGVDAVRALTYPVPGLEVDLVVADRGTARDLSAGARATLDTPVGDVYVAGGKFWRELIALGGISLVVDAWKLRLEGALPWEMDARDVRTARLTAGLDWIGGDTQLSLEYHHNGLGSTRSAEYVVLLTSPEITRGETYYLGRHLAGALAAHRPTDRLALSLVTLANLNDPSAALLPAVTYDVGQNTRISVGGLVAFGAVPVFPAGALPRVESEFGTFGDFGYAQVSVYF